MNPARPTSDFIPQFESINKSKETLVILEIQNQKENQDVTPQSNHSNLFSLKSDAENIQIDNRYEDPVETNFVDKVKMGIASFQ